MARAFARVRAQRFRSPHVARGLEVARRAACGERSLREPTAVAVIGARGAAAAFFPAEAESAEQIDRRDRGQGAERPGLFAIAAAPVGGGEGDGSDVERIAGNPAPDPRRRVM